LALEALALLVVEPTQLLENLGMAGIALEDALVGSLGAVIL
jgi:hypothetical protein